MTVLQKILFPKTRIQNIKSLYYNLLHGNVNIHQDELVLLPDTKISFNSYFNSFYEAYWRAFTNIDTLSIKIALIGRGILSVYRDSAINGCYELEKIDFDTTTLHSFIVKVDLSENIFEDEGRIFIDIMAFDKVVIKSIEIVNNDIIHKKLTIGICTFNRENFLYKNLEALVNLSKVFTNISKVFIVNQGEHFSDKKLIQLIDNHKNFLQVIKQDNLGGTGGFTRTLYEASNSNISDYHLLMDDDVIIDTNVIQTAFTFASMATKPIAVGGQMLDLLRPNIIHEYGSKVDKFGYIKPLFSNMNMSDIAQLLVFNKVTHIDYNAWWFCMIPTSIVKTIHLPAPIFIRGDDEEYGLRLKDHGIETVGLPGVALWHEPFYTKVGGWQVYYDFRNRMILSSSYSSLKNEHSSHLFLRIYKLLLCHDYQSVKLILEAIKDFSKGVKLFQEGAENIHSRISKLSKEYAPESVSVVFKPMLDENANKKWQTNERRLQFVKQTVLLSSVDFSKKTPKHLWDRHVTPENVQCLPYIKSNGIQSYHYLYTPNKVLFRQLLKEIIQAQKIYIETIQKNDWHNIDKNKHESYWEAIFE